MSTLTLTLGGVDFLPQYKTGSAKIKAQLSNQGDSMTMTITQKSGQSAPSVGKEIVFKDGSRFLFAGFITKAVPVEFGVGQFTVYTIEATDYTYILINKNAQSSYASKTLSYIVTDLLATNVAASYGMTHVNTPTGPTIATINFNHISCRQAFENLAKVTGYTWWVDYEKDVHFVPISSGGTGAPEKFTDAASGNHEQMTISYDLSQVRNDITVIGGTQESAQYTQVILGDGNAREWVLIYPVFTMVSVELSLGGGAYAAQTVGVDPKDDETLFFAMYSSDRGSVRLSSGSTTLGATDKLRVKFTYPLNVLTEVKSASSIAAMKALEGGDGIHSYTINDSTIVSNAQAQQRALKELDAFANPTLIGKVITRTGILTAGSYFAPGQLLTINSPAYGINIDTPYMIQSVVTTLNESGSSIEYRYEITFGGRNVGVVDFLQALATPETPLDTSGQVTKIQSVAEDIVITETITRDSNTKNIAETVSIVEAAPTKVNVTPPFKWGVDATANKGVWGKSEWA